MSSTMALLFCGGVAWTCLPRTILYHPSSAHSPGHWKTSIDLSLQSPCPFSFFSYFLFSPFKLLHVDISGDKKLWLNQMLLPVAGWGFSTFMGFRLRMNLGSEWGPQVCVYVNCLWRYRELLWWSYWFCRFLVLGLPRGFKWDWGHIVLGAVYIKTKRQYLPHRSWSLDSIRPKGKSQLYNEMMKVTHFKVAKLELVS